jgi:hypothetical protein
MQQGIPDKVQPNTRGFAARFLRNVPRKVALFAGMAAVLALIIGAGFASMSSSGAATPLETVVVRWTVVGCLVVGVVAYVIGGRTSGEQRE